MYFSLNVCRLHDWNEIYRIKKNGNWQMISDLWAFSITEDKLYEKYIEAKKEGDALKEIVVDNKIIEVPHKIEEIHRMLSIEQNQRDKDFNDKIGNLMVEMFDCEYDVRIICHRIEKPKHLFTYEELFEKSKRVQDYYFFIQVNFNGEIVVTGASNRHIQPRMSDDCAILCDSIITSEPEPIQKGKLFKIYVRLLQKWEEHLHIGMRTTFNMRHFQFHDFNVSIENINKLYEEIEKENQ